GVNTSSPDGKSLSPKIVLLPPAIFMLPSGIGTAKSPIRISPPWMIASVQPPNGICPVGPPYEMVASRSQPSKNVNDSGSPDPLAADSVLELLPDEPSEPVDMSELGAAPAMPVPTSATDAPSAVAPPRTRRVSVCV